MNPDRRAGIGLQNGLSPEPRARAGGDLPRWAMSPVFAARLTLATLTGLGAAAVDQITSPIVTAQTVCKGRLTVVGVKFADHPNLGRERIADPTDFYLGNADFKVVEIYDAVGKTKFDAWDGKDLAKKPKPIASGNMSDQGTHSIASTAFSGECDENQGGAKRVWLAFQSDKDKAIYPEVVGNNRLRVHVAGRNEYRITELQGVANNGNFPIKKVGEVIAEITSKLGTPVPFTDPEQLRGDAKTISEANRKSLREQIAKLVQEQEERKKAREVLPSPTAAVTPTASSELVQAKLDQFASQIGGQIDKLDKTTAGLQEDLRGQAQTTNTSLANLNTVLQDQKMSLEATGRRIQALENTIKATATPTPTVPFGGVLEEVGKLADRLPVKEVWPWALGILAALGSILGYRRWIPGTYNIRGRVIPAHLNIGGRKII